MEEDITTIVVHAIQKCNNDLKEDTDRYVAKRHTRGFRARDTVYRCNEVWVTHMTKTLVPLLHQVVLANERQIVTRMWRKLTLAIFTLVTSVAAASLFVGVL